MSTDGEETQNRSINLLAQGETGVTDDPAPSNEEESQQNVIRAAVKRAMEPEP